MNLKNRLLGLVLLSFVLLALSGCLLPPNGGGTGGPGRNATGPVGPNGSTGNLGGPINGSLTGSNGSLSGIDDWLFTPSTGEAGGAPGSGPVYSTGGPMPSPTGGAASSNLGYSTGGAKDINNFRENIKAGYLPLPTDITYEGLYYDYFFETGKIGGCEKLFCPAYSQAISSDPLSNQTEYYLSVGLDSNIKESDFARKKLNLVIVQDISGSMGSSFDAYYYDRFGNRQNLPENDTEKMTKLEVATRSINALIDHLGPDDRLGIVLFDQDGYVAKPLKRVGDTDIAKLKAHILELEPQGSTNFAAGMDKGTGLFDAYLNDSEYDNRIIFLTDAQPNTDDTTEGGLFGRSALNSKRGVYTTFIGIGVDFNTELVEIVSKTRGANYYSVHSSTQFKQRMDDEFDYMVTPMVFDLRLQVQGDGFDIEKVYGSPDADEASGEIMKVSTLFPSKSEGGAVKGGIILLKLKKTSDEPVLNLTVFYEDRQGRMQSDVKTVRFEARSGEFFQNSGIRKAVLLARYANLMKSWIIEQRKNVSDDDWMLPRPMNYEAGERLCAHPGGGCGILIPDERWIRLGRWERQSVNLTVAPPYPELFGRFGEYFKEEAKAIGDQTLDKEAQTLDLLVSNGAKLGAG